MLPVSSYPYSASMPIMNYESDMLCAQPNVFT
jgi:hypothetical protein